MRTVYDHTDIVTEQNSQRVLVQQLLQGQAAIMLALQSIARQETEMATNAEILKGKVDDLKSDVAAGRVSIDKAVAAFNGIAAQYKAAKDQLDELIKTNGTPEQFQALAADMDTVNTEMDKQRADLDAVVGANTPSA